MVRVYYIHQFLESDSSQSWESSPFTSYDRDSRRKISQDHESFTAGSV